jgi:hypothetical protein
VKITLVLWQWMPIALFNAKKNDSILGFSTLKKMNAFCPFQR